jgi:glycosyltransferase involved in cell wall biosynthesis
MLGLELGNAEVVYNPCKLSGENVPEYPTIENGYRIALVGRIECFHKGYDLLLEVIKAEKWKKRNVQFTLYGNGPHTELIKQNCKRMDIKNLKLSGYNEDVLEIWKQNHLLCMPSRMEGQALSLIEAMWCNRAAVVTDVGGATELIDEGVSGFIAKWATVDEIDNALERAWSRREEWKIMGENAGTALRSKYPADAVGYFNERVKDILKQTS